MLNPVPPNLMNYSAITSVYDGLPAGPNSTQSGMKFETPTRQVLQMVGSQLMADTTPGDKYILFMTDGEPDYCDDGNALCPPDGVVWQLQTLKAAGITTLVFGLKATIAQDLPAGVLRGVRERGRGRTDRRRRCAPARRGSRTSSTSASTRRRRRTTLRWLDDGLPVGGRQRHLSGGSERLPRATLGTYCDDRGPDDSRTDPT